MEVVVGCDALAVAVSTALDKVGREHLVVVAKATWNLPQSGQAACQIAPQPLAYRDAYIGEPGESAMLHGDDFARYKPRCDVLFDACAHPPGGKGVETLGIEVRVGSLVKRLRVHGPRSWQSYGNSYRPGRADAFLKLPLHYGLAFGGSREWLSHAETHIEAHAANPVGLGWYGPHTWRGADGEPMPQIEAFDEPIVRPDVEARPMALSALGRHWQPRAGLAGTYDAAWQRDTAPFLPEDFDERYHQCAPEDQQIDYPQGGEPVSLIHLLPDQAALHFELPDFDGVKVRVLRQDYSTEEPPALVDTLYFETEHRRFSAVWRASIPLRRHIQEIAVVAVGPIDPDWWRAKTLGLDAPCGGCGKRT